MDLRKSEQDIQHGVPDQTPTKSYSVVVGTMLPQTDTHPEQFQLEVQKPKRVITCYLTPEQTTITDGLVGKLVEVHGLVFRQRGTEIPIAIRNILRIEEVPPKLVGAALRAQGIWHWPENAPSPAEVIRRLRDGE